VIVLQVTGAFAVLAGVLGVYLALSVHLAVTCLSLRPLDRPAEWGRLCVLWPLYVGRAGVAVTVGTVAEREVPEPVEGELLW
jgi:hypothetical protein